MDSSGIAMWVVSVDDSSRAMWPLIFKILDPAERANAERFRFERRRQQYVVAHGLKRLMLSAFQGLPTSAWEFYVGPHGKPLLRSFPSLHFNLSHFDGLVACAFSRTLEVGLDVERVTRDAPIELAQHYFAPEEEQWLNGLPAPALQMGFSNSGP
jgi:4'-phosphopantetheinyl transferase